MTPENLLLALNPIVAADNHGRTFRYQDVLADEGYETLMQMDEVQRLLDRAKEHCV